VVHLVPSLVIDPTLSPIESEVQVVELIPPLVDSTLPLKSEVDTAQVLLVTTYNSREGGFSLVSTKPPPSTKVISFDWNGLKTPCLPSYFPLQIIAQVCDINIFHSIIDEGTYVSLLSSNTWKALGSPQVVPNTHNLFSFNRRSN
jgi:hypothetical protein